MLEQVEDGDGKAVIGWQQSRAFGDNPVSTVVRVAGKSNVEAILQADQPLHDVKARMGPCGSGHPNRLS